MSNVNKSRGFRSRGAPPVRPQEEAVHVRSYINKRQEPSLRPPRQAPTRTLEQGPPPPMHLSKTSSEEKNDPLYHESFFPDAGEELRPRHDELYLYSGADGLQLVIEQLITYYKSMATGFSKRVPSSVFAYYCGVITYARMLRVHSGNGFSISDDEHRFCEQVDSLDFYIPNGLKSYLAGFGNVTVPESRELLFRMWDREYVTDEDDNIGWFGRISPETHFLYRSYPCLSVFTARIRADIDFTLGEGEERWQLPVLIAPEGDVLHPNGNLLGYAPATRLTGIQRDWLTDRGVWAGITSENPTLVLNTSLLRAIQAELQAVERLAISKLDIVTRQGSLAQVPYTEYINEGVEYQCPLYQKSTQRLIGCFSYLGSAFNYRVRRPTATTRLSRPHWFIYDLPPAGLPLGDYHGTVNSLFDATSSIINNDVYRTTELNARTRIDRIVRTLGLAT